jgi:hypothetical protein
VEKNPCNFQLIDGKVALAVTNVALSSAPCRLLFGFDGESVANFQLVDRNLRLPPANVEKHRCNVNKSVANVDKSVGNGKEATHNGRLPKSEVRKRAHEGAELDCVAIFI